ncbi:hypothetical protein H0E84_08460 [Luteimonas sp. SJ-92]|uniref:Uncharacterized protein n=1 Tax=Luteimonas salinisoli TaxID=2752307 RepID=A0A853JCQ8_9GAMM|nr:hypothetical protein [Luteimonas salinisoli]NZA26417.1 hypothetical protein [Luteimonas salinisoli]
MMGDGRSDQAAPEDEPRDEGAAGEEPTQEDGPVSQKGGRDDDGEAREDAEDIRRKAPTGLPGAAGGGLIGG